MLTPKATYDSHGIMPQPSDESTFITSLDILSERIHDSKIACMSGFGDLKIRLEVATPRALNRSVVNRELRMIELREEVNRLLTAQGKLPIYETDAIKESASYGQIYA